MDYYRSLSDRVIPSGPRFRIGTKNVEITEGATPSGDIKVQVKFPVDDDTTAENGSIDMTDTFILSREGRAVQSFNRQIKWNGLGSATLWQKRESDYRSAAAPSKVLQQQFVDQVVTKAQVLEAIRGDSAAMQFIVDSWHALQNGLGDNQYQFFQKDPGSFATVEKTANGYKVKLSWVADNDKDAKNGRIIMEDQFILDENKKFKSHLRQWRVHPQSEGNVPSTSLTSLYGVSKPPKAQAQALLNVILPLLFTSPPAGKTETGQGSVGMGPTTVTQPNGGTGKSIEVAGPRVETQTRSATTSRGGLTYEFTFSQMNKSERNAHTENAGALLTRAVGPNLRTQLARKGISGTMKFLFDIKFAENGSVTRVKATVLHNGLGLNESDLSGSLKGAALRIHQNLRAQNGLSGDTLRVPLTVEIQ